MFEPKAKRPKKTKETKKRKVSPQSDQSEPEAPDLKISGISSALEGGPRRSSRHSGKVIDYSKEHQDKLPRSAALTSGIKSHENEGPQGQGGIRIHNPSVFLSPKPNLETNLILQKNLWTYSGGRSWDMVADAKGM